MSPALVGGFPSTAPPGKSFEMNLTQQTQTPWLLSFNAEGARGGRTTQTSVSGSVQHLGIPKELTPPAELV